MEIVKGASASQAAHFLVSSFMTLLLHAVILPLALHAMKVGPALDFITTQTTQLSINFRRNLVSTEFCLG